MNDPALLARHFDDPTSDDLARLVERHVDWVHSAALRQTRGDAALAQDVTQAVFLLLSRKAASLRNRDNLGGWLFATTRNVARHALRSNARRRRHEWEAGMSTIEQRRRPEPSPNWQDLAPRLDELVGKLPGADREAVLLRFYRKLRFADVGAALGVSEEAARKRVTRAVDRLRDLFGNSGLSVSTVALAELMTNTVTMPAGVQITGAAAAGGAGPAALALAREVTVALMWTKLAAVGGSVAAAAVVGFIAVALVQSSHASRSRVNGDASAIGVSGSAWGWEISHAQRPIPPSTGDRRYGLDLDRFVLHDLSPAPGTTPTWDERVAQVRATGVDVIVDDRPNEPGLYLIEMAGSLVGASEWDRLSARQLLRDSVATRTLRFPDRDRPRDQKDWAVASRRVQLREGQTRTVLFHTREGGVGILQLLSRDPDDNSIKVRYKLARVGRRASTNPTTSAAR
jgi:RNA polymerase sigma factor (sigma-70 family)